MKKLISQTSKARELRRNLTPHEQRLWRLLRNRQFAGYKFRRQFVIGRYIVDFCCLKEKLVIELDGSQHNSNDGLKRDLVRDKYIQDHGYRILRFWNHDLDQMTDAVLDKIYLELKGINNPSPLTPLPEGEGNSNIRE